jgi:hypothetical protein
MSDPPAHQRSFIARTHKSNADQDGRCESVRQGRRRREWLVRSGVHPEGQSLDT